jgi:hypothetical protein
VTSTEDRTQALGAARAAAAGHDVVIDEDDLLDAIELFDATLSALDFAQAAAKLVYDIAVLAARDQRATPVALAALASLSGLGLGDVYVHQLADIVHRERRVMENLLASVLTVLPDRYSGLRDDLRLLGHVRIRVLLQIGLKPLFVTEP